MTDEPTVVPPPSGALAHPPGEETVASDTAAEAGGPIQNLPTQNLPTQNLPPRRSSLGVTRLIQALWLGSGAFLMLTASAAFSAASNTTDAANVVGAVLTRWHYIGLFAPLLLLFLEWRRSRPAMLVILFIAILLASFQALIDTRIRVMRNESYVAISSLPHDDPVRRQFGILHGMSQLFLIGQVIAAGVAVATRE
jgi:hypothetical protein